MAAHTDARAPRLEVVQVRVEAERIVDLRDADTLARVGVDLADAVAPWQDTAAHGGTPPSWGVRETLDAAGAAGIIDPSRTKPGLWHLVLFDWNSGEGSPVVSVVEDTV